MYAGGERIKIEAEPCVIQDVIELSESEYSRFCQNLLDDYIFIAKHQDAMFYEKVRIMPCW